MRRVVAIAALFLFAGEAQAQTNFLDNPRPYVGAGAAYAMVDTGIKTTGTANIDDKDLGYKFFGGVQLNKYLGVEAFYAKLGEATLTGNSGDTATLNGNTVTFGGPGELTISGWTVGAAATIGYPVHQYFNPYAKIGFHRWEVEAEGRGIGRAAASVNNDGVNVLFGAGVQSNITDSVSLRGEWERFSLDKNDVDMITASLIYRF